MNYLKNSNYRYKSMNKNKKSPSIQDRQGFHKKNVISNNYELEYYSNTSHYSVIESIVFK